MPDDTTNLEGAKRTPESAYQRWVAETLSRGGEKARELRSQLKLEQERCKIDSMPPGPKKLLALRLNEINQLKLYRTPRSATLIRKVRARLRESRATTAERSPGSAPESGSREAIRRESVAHQTNGPPPPLIEALDTLARAIDVLREQLTASTAAPSDDWIPQGQGPLKPRVHTRLCRDLLERGDERAAKRGRVHFLRASAITEHLRGSPRETPERVAPGIPISAGARLLAELGGVQ